VLILFSIKALRFFCAEYRALDSSIGRERNQRGSSFEDQAFTVVKDLVVHELERRNASRHGALRAVPNLSWVDQQEKHVGEVDVVILDSQDNVVALVELKAHCFELVGGFWQQKLKAKNKDFKIMLSESNLLDCDENIPVFVVTVSNGFCFIFVCKKKP